MHLSIRWKFILSIGITLIVTYLGLLTWDYWWQRRLETDAMQARVAEEAKITADRLNDRLTTIESSLTNLGNELISRPPNTVPALMNVLAARQWPAGTGQQLQFFIAFDPAFAAASNLPPGYQIVAGPPGGRGRGGGGGGGGGRGGRGQGRGDPQQDGRGARFDQGPGGRFNGPGPDRGGRFNGPGPEEPPPDARIFAQGRGRGGPGIGPGTQPAFGGVTLDPLAEFDPNTEQFYARAVELKRAVWSDPHVVRAHGGSEPRVAQFRTTFSIPLIVNDRIIGVIAAAAAPQFAGVGFAGRGGGIGRGGTLPIQAARPSTAPAETDPDGFVREFTIIGNEGRVIFPASRGSGNRESIVDWAKSNGMTDLADDLSSTFEGENSAVKVYRLHDAPDIIPGAKAGENYWVAFAPVASTDWVVASAISESEHMAPIVQRLWHRALFLIGGLVVLLGVTTFVSIRVSRPIEKMAKAVNELASGNLDAHVSDVQSSDEVGQLATAFNTMTGQLKQHVAALTEQTAAREIVEAELRIARQIQTDLLPKTFPPFPNRTEFDLHAVNVPAHRVAGDFYDFFFTPDDLLTIVIADVSGKGVPAALLMAVTRTIIRNLAMEGLTPGKIAERANAMLIQDISDSMFVTMFLCQYDTKTGRILYVNAGHPRPYCFGTSGEPEEFGDITGALLGVIPAGPEWTYEQHEGMLEVGQTLLLYTDGVSEARSPRGDMLRRAGVEQLIRKHQNDSVQDVCNGIVEDLNEYQAGQPADDVTLVALRRS